MRYWIYVEPASTGCADPVWTIMADRAVLAQYWPYWSQKMIVAGKGDQLDQEKCIQDWATIHWAVEATKENLQRIVDE